MNPPWRRLPRLSWVAATAAVPWDDPGRVAALLVSPLAMFTFPLLVAARATGQLAAGKGSLLLVLHRRRAVLPALAVLLVGLQTLGLGYCMGGALDALLTPGAAGMAGVAIAAVGVAGIVVAVWSCAATAVLVGYRVHTWLRRWGARHGQPAITVAPFTRPPGAIELACANAWPRRQGHGKALWDALARHATQTGRPFVAHAASCELARSYAARPGRRTGRSRHSGGA